MIGWGMIERGMIWKGDAIPFMELGLIVNDPIRSIRAALIVLVLKLCVKGVLGANANYRHKETITDSETTV
eukprot:2271312-Ditylum_brightwellii.AAC.1